MPFHTSTYKFVSNTHKSIYCRTCVFVYHTATTYIYQELRHWCTFRTKYTAFQYTYTCMHTIILSVIFQDKNLHNLGILSFLLILPKKRALQRRATELCTMNVHIIFHQTFINGVYRVIVTIRSHFYSLRIIIYTNTFILCH